MAKTFVGTVSSSAADKTIVVTVSTSKTHPLYRKRYSVTKKFMAHDEKNEAQTGDRVRIVETRPLSARKRFALDKILERATVQHVEKEVPAEVAEVVKKPKAADEESSSTEATEDKK
jgi:small subunit ribosomal protein S17